MAKTAFAPRRDYSPRIPQLLILLLFVTFSPPRPLLACNYVKTVAGDGSAVVGRDMQFALPPSQFPSTFRTYPVGRTYTSPTAAYLPGLSWTVKYGYLGINSFLDATVDGLNTQGLQCSGLYFPGYAKYQRARPSQRRRVVAQTYFCDWALALHASVADVNGTLSSIIVEGIWVPTLGVAPLHYAITDRTGAGIVVEYMNRMLHVYDNFPGVMTNSPPYDWQVTNLRQYAPTMFPQNPQPIVYGNVRLTATGNWGSMVGLPGNVQGASRFVRLAVMLHWAQQRQLIPTAKKAMNLMSHMINIGDQINGTATPALSMQTNPRTGKKEVVVTSEGESSIWSVRYNLRDLNLYFRSYNNPVWQFINMKKLDFRSGAKRVTLNVYADTPAPDVTGQFKPSTTNAL